jgi:hypothetical protein
MNILLTVRVLAHRILTRSRATFVGTALTVLCFVWCRLRRVRRGVLGRGRRGKNAKIEGGVFSCEHREVLRTQGSKGEEGESGKKYRRGTGEGAEGIRMLDALVAFYLSYRRWLRMLLF